jgi:hypothetical protein
MKVSFSGNFVVKQKIWFPSENKMLSPVTVQNQNGQFSVLGIRKIINSLQHSRNIASQFSSSAYVQINKYLLVYDP